MFVSIIKRRMSSGILLNIDATLGLILNSRL